MNHAPSDPVHCDDLDRLALDLLSAELAPADRAALDAHLASCPRCRAEHAGLAVTWEALGSLPAGEPSPALRQSVDQLICAERAAIEASARATPTAVGGPWWMSLAATMVPRQPAWQLAAGLALLAVGFTGGALASHRRSTPELASLEGEIRSLRGLVSLTLLHQESASARLQGVSFGRSLSGRGNAGDVDPEVLRALLVTVTADSSANVRLAAVDALAAAAGEPTVRAALLDHLAADPSPLVQIGIVDLLLDHAPRASSGPAARHEIDRLLALARGPATDPNGIRSSASDPLPPTVRDYLRQRLSTST
jgi:anti-sigma factor RsiW